MMLLWQSRLCQDLGDHETGKGLEAATSLRVCRGRFIITPTLTIFFALSVDISYSKFLSCDRLELILVEYFVITVLAG